MPFEDGLVFAGRDEAHPATAEFRTDDFAPCTTRRPTGSGSSPTATSTWTTSTHRCSPTRARIADGGPTAVGAGPATAIDVRGDLPKFAATGLLLATANHVVMYAFGALPASIASPIVNTQAIIAVVLGGIVLGEEQFRIRLVAAGLAVVGVTPIAMG